MDLYHKAPGPHRGDFEDSAARLRRLRGMTAPPFLPGSAADLGRRTSGRPIYVSGEFSLSRDVFAACRQWLLRQLGGAELVHARDVWTSLDDWEERFPAENMRFGAMLLTTTAEEGRHVIGSVVATEVATFCGSRRPVGWLAVSSGPCIRFSAHFAVEAVSGGDLVRYATVAPAVDAEPFAPVCAYPVPRAGRPLIRAV